MRKQLAIIQLKEKTTLLAQARERIAELERQVVELPALRVHAAQQQQVLDDAVQLIARQRATIERHRELAQQICT